MALRRKDHSLDS